MISSVNKMPNKLNVLKTRRNCYNMLDLDERKNKKQRTEAEAEAAGAAGAQKQQAEEQQKAVLSIKLDVDPRPDEDAHDNTMYVMLMSNKGFHGGLINPFAGVQNLNAYSTELQLTRVKDQNNSMEVEFRSYLNSADIEKSDIVDNKYSLGLDFERDPKILICQNDGVKMFRDTVKTVTLIHPGDFSGLLAKNEPEGRAYVAAMERWSKIRKAAEENRVLLCKFVRSTLPSV